MRKERGGRNGINPVEHVNIRTVDQKGEQICHQTQRIRDQLGSILRLVDQLPGPARPASREGEITEEAIRNIIKMRKRRCEFFEDGLFADPAWDILLELYLSELSQQRVTITSLSDAAAVPATTALRWIGNLEAKGLIQRRGDPFDGRRVFMSLTPIGLQKMEAYFRNAPDSALI